MKATYSQDLKCAKTIVGLLVCIPIDIYMHTLCREIGTDTEPKPGRDKENFADFWNRFSVRSSLILLDLSRHSD